MRRASIKVLYTLSVLVLVYCAGCLHYFSTISSKDEYKRSIPVVSKTGYTVNTVAPRSEFNSKMSYVMGTSFYDQLTGSFANLLSLQCWAYSLGNDTRVVEPTLLGSVLNINLKGLIYNNDTSAMFDDFFNKAEWNEMSSKRYAAPLVTWKHFIEYAPRKLILVDKPNKPLTKLFFEYAKLLEEKYDFEVVRKINFSMKLLNATAFKKLVYGKYDPHEASVIFRAWGGIASGNLYNRVGVSGTTCGRTITGFTPVSSKIIQDGIRYINKYIENGITKGYISVMVRMEHFLRKHQYFEHKTEKEILDVTMTCLNNLVSEVKALKNEHEVDAVFLTMDCRDSGSYMFKIASPDDVTAMANNAMIKLFSMLYGNSSTLEEWDRSFENTVSFPKVTGYIALVQKHLAAKGTCLLTVGGGSFQSTAHQLYSTYHPQGLKCNYQVKSC